MHVMKRLILISVILPMISTIFPSPAQPASDVIPCDTVAVEKKLIVDSLVLGKSILNLVNVNQDAAITDSMNLNIARNSIKQVKGYRVRIYFSNEQSAREESAAAQARFRALYPEHEAYRSFVNPNFKVTAGDFLSKSEALFLKAAIIHQFPSAFVVREDINLTY